MINPNLALARLWYQRADAIRWKVARIASQVVGTNRKGLTLEMADAIGRKVDTVEALARAYELFGAMVRNEWLNNRTSVSIRKLHNLKCRVLYCIMNWRQESRNRWQSVNGKSTGSPFL